VVAVVLDDTGFSHLGCYGSGIATPHMDGLAQGGLRYNRFHVTSLCSPTRASFFTGRNHHAVGMGFLADIPLSYPGYTGRIPMSAATLPRILKDAGYSTMCVGKWHLTPRFERSAAGPFHTWPLGLGFERYYGFLQGDANHWAPQLARDNHFVEPPPGPAEGYHLTEDLADAAIRMVVDQQQGAPGKPFFLYFALGAMHAPHHVGPAWVEPYRGAFDHGWDAWREEIFARQLSSGVVPPGAVLTERPPWVDAWDSLAPDERRLYAREQEVFAGFLTHADAQIGRLLGTLRDRGLLDNTLVIVFSDNGASAEGGVHGSVNEHRFSARLQESLADNLSAIDEWGGPRTYNHYAWAWAWAGNTPLRLWKRYTWLGGTRTPLLVHWPKVIRESGGVRGQFAHVVDLAPTILDAIGIEKPEVVDGVDQQRVDGASLLSSFTDPTAADARSTQYFEMMGSRSIVHGRWKATTDHVVFGVLHEEQRMLGSRDFDEDHWALFDLTSDFSESSDVAAANPEVVGELEELWFSEAERNQVLPVDDTLVNRLGAFVPPAYPPGNDATFVPGAGPVSDEALPLLFGGFRITADLEVHAGGAEGVVFAVGDWNGGYSLYLINGTAYFTFSRAGQVIELSSLLSLGEGRHSLGVSHVAGHGARSAFTLLHAQERLASAFFEGSLPPALQHGGAVLRIGYDAGLPVSERYRPPAPFTGMVRSLRYETPGAPVDPVEEVRAALHAD
jgi:arylsulfatase